MKKYYKRLIAFVFLVHAFHYSYGQYDAMFTQYMYNEMFINPGYTGSREAMSATLLHRQQWVNFPGRPVTTTFSLHGPLHQNKMGLGLSVLNEKLGALNRNLVYLNYAYRVKTGKTGSLAFGVMGGLHNQLQKFSELKASKDGSPDPQVAQNSPNINSFNFGAGLYYSTKTFYTGVSIPRMINDKVVADAGGNAQAMTGLDASAFHYYFTLGKVFNLNNNLALKTQGMLKTVSGAPAQVDVNINFLICRMLWLGAGYRSKAAATAFLGAQVSTQFFVGYSYDYDLNGLQQYSNGSHEIVLNYLFTYKLKKLLSPRYF